MRKTLVIAAIVFLAPIAIVVAMHPEETQEALKDAHRWAKKTFPEPEVKSKPVSC